MKSNFKSGLLKSLSFMGLCLMLSLSANPVFAQARTVSGVVSSTDGPLEGATVILKGSLDYVLTDEDGKFEFPRELNKDDVLLITALGLEDAEVVIEADTNFISPILADDPVVIIAALRTEPSKKSRQPEQQ
ncbi:carboxypeptidase-like regulatory domain-containing protein [Gilvibacter sp.]|uniref:carboxypeptidase-like regulatory domain-containing protein n=1 Tax=Gilvibacter sp. TaxID=2729997 RepID=UPI0035BE70EB